MIPARRALNFHVAIFAASCNLAFMGMHVLGRKCPICGKKGLVIGADESGVAFRPQGWLLKSLGARKIACPHCGAVMAALVPAALKSLQEALRADRVIETVTYHARPRRIKKPPPDDP